MSAETNILRHELAETRRKLAEQKAYAAECANALAVSQDECERLRRDNFELCKRLGIAPEVSAFSKKDAP